VLIGISGKIGAGKTTCADVGVNIYNAHKTAFAKALKQEVIAALTRMNAPFTYANLYGTFEQKAKFTFVRLLDIPLTFVAHGFYSITKPQGNVFKFSFRDFLQWYGTYRREQNPDYWVEKFLASYDDTLFTIVDDVRYISEAEAIKTCGGFLIRINRPDFPNNNTHISELELDTYRGFNLIITNNSTKEQYIELCKSGLNYIRTAFAN